MSYFHFVGSSQSNFRKRKVGACWSLPEKSEAFNSRLCNSNLSLTALKNQSGGGKSESGSMWFPRCLSAKPAGILTVGFLFWKAGKGGRDKNLRNLSALLKIKQFIITHLFLNCLATKNKMGRDRQEKNFFFPQSLAALGLNDRTGKGGTGLEKTAFFIQGEDRHIQKWPYKVRKNKTKLHYHFNNKIPCRVGQVPCDFS